MSNNNTRVPWPFYSPKGALEDPLHCSPGAGQAGMGSTKH